MVGDTVRVSNLASNVDEESLRYIFQNIGEIRSVTVHYGADGRAVGTAEIVFVNTSHAQRAVDELDQAEVDGRIMFVQLVGQLVEQVIQSPMVVPRGPRRDERNDRARSHDRERHDRRDRRDNGSRPERHDRRGGAKHANGDHAEKPKQDRQTQRRAVSAEDLDKELEDYRSAAAATDASAADQ